jgi:hypothetical protein
VKLPEDCINKNNFTLKPERELMQRAQKEKQQLQRQRRFENVF